LLIFLKFSVILESLKGVFLERAEEEEGKGEEEEKEEEEEQKQKELMAVTVEGVTSHVTRDTQVCSYQISPPWDHLIIQFVRTTFYKVN